MGIIYKGSTEINPGAKNLPQIIGKDLKFHLTYSSKSYPENNTWVNLIDGESLRFNHERNSFVYIGPLIPQGGGGGLPPLVPPLFNGKALIFNGIDRIVLNFNPPGHKINNVSNLTASLWIKQYQESNLNSGIFWISDAFNRMVFIRYNNINQMLYVGTENKSINVASNVDLINKWTNITITRSSDIKIYINSVLVNSQYNEVYLGLWNIFSKYITIGSLFFAGYPQDYFNGEISIVSVYDRALSHQEIQTNYNNLKGKYI